MVDDAIEVQNEHQDNTQIEEEERVEENDVIAKDEETNPTDQEHESIQAND